MSKFSNIGGTSDPEEFYQRHYNPGNYHWETSGKHAYNVLLKMSGKEPNKSKKEKIETVRGLSREDVICKHCSLKIKKGSEVIKKGSDYFHPNCFK